MSTKSYGIICDRISSGLGPGGKICKVRGYLTSESNDIKEIEAVSHERSLIKKGEATYLEVGVIPNYRRPHEPKPSLDKFLIEFGQESIQGLWRIWVDESSLVKLTEKQ